MEAVEHETSSDAPAAPPMELDRIVPPSRATLSFRRFQLLPRERRLLRDGVSVEIGSRAFDLLLILVRSPGEVVEKGAIVDFVWPSTIVDECNLRFQMASLRKVLGRDRDVIKTIQGRGYLFIADVASTASSPPTWSSEDEGGIAAEGLAAVEAVSDGVRPSSAVAVIDDDDCTREALDGLLRSSGFATQCYASVAAFVGREPDRDPGCLVLDVCMPGCSGLELQADLVRAGVRLPIIFISGHADIHMSVRAMKAGAMEFLTKPVRHGELLDAITGALGRHHVAA